MLSGPCSPSSTTSSPTSTAPSTPKTQEGAGGVRGVHERAAEVLRGEHPLEQGELAVGCLFVGVSGSEVGVDTDELRSEDLTSLTCLVRLYTPAVHAGVDLEMSLKTRVGRDTLRARERVGRDLQAIITGEGEFIRQEVRKDEDRGSNASASELGTFFGSGDG